MVQPSHTGGKRGIVPGFWMAGITRRLQVHHPLDISLVIEYAPLIWRCLCRDSAILPPDRREHYATTLYRHTGSLSTAVATVGGISTRRGWVDISGEHRA